MPEDRKASDHTPPEGTVVNIQVDLSYPQDVLEAEFKSALQEAKGKHQQLEEQGRLRKRPERLRLDKIDFYLQVYDRAEGGEPYRTIAFTLNQPKSTIQSAHVAAIRLIGSSEALEKSAKPRAKKQSEHKPFDFERHIQECQICKVGEGIAQYCAGCRSWLEVHIVPKYIPFDEMRADGSWRGERDELEEDALPEPQNMDAERPPGGRGQEEPD